MPDRSCLLHPALASPASARPLAEVGASDRARMGVVLQGAALLSHLDTVGWRLAGGFEPVRVVMDGGAPVLVGVEVEPGSSPVLPQERLCELLRLVFEGRETGDGGLEIAGRGSARRAARDLVRRWRQRLAPVGPDRAVGHLFGAAPWLFEPELGRARRALVAEVVAADGARRLHVAGPAGLGRAVAGRGLELEAARGLLAGDGVRELVATGARAAGGDRRADPRALAADGEHRQAVALWRLEPPAENDHAARLAFADALDACGRFEEAVAVASALPGLSAAVLVLRCRLDLGDRRAVRRALARLERSGELEAPDLAPAVALALARVAVRAVADMGARAAAEAERWVVWAREVAARGAAADRAAVELLAAAAAWDRGESEETERSLGRFRDLTCPDGSETGSGGAAGKPAEGRRALSSDLLWRAEQVAALSALAAGEEPAAVAALSRALAVDRRGLRRWQAGALWSDLGLARARTGDLPGAERAFLHAVRLLGRCDGPRGATLALCNLAEVRLRRGRLDGVAAILERSLAANRASGNRRATVQDLVLAARLELVLGRPEAALERVAEAERAGGGADWYTAERRLLEARALGWLARPDEAAAALAGADLLSAELEPEERPAVRALAGDWDGAVAEAEGTPFAALWSSVADGGEPPLPLWRPVEELESYRMARLVLDVEVAAAGARPGRPPVAPAPLRRRAAGTLRRLGAVALADRLDRLDGGGGVWRALELYLGGDSEPGDPTALRLLFEAAGYPEARLEWMGDGDPLATLRGADREILVGGAGGPEELAAPASRGGTLSLRTARVDPRLRALFALARRDAVPAPLPEPVPEPGRMIGESPALAEALARLDRLATGEVPVLLGGESGTGKELAARRLHRRSRRREAPFVPVNCAAVQETLLTSDLFGHVQGAFTGAERDRAGVFETARGGTVFLDEIGDLPLSAQGMLLRVLQEGEVRRVGESVARPVDARVVAATHRDLATMVAAGSFREDLYYRLAVARVDLPPLRERGGDLLLLAESFLERWGGGWSLAPATRQALVAHRFPGNVRELENVLRVGTTLAGQGATIALEHLPPEIAAASRPTRAQGAGAEPSTEASYRAKVDAYRRRLVAEALAAEDGNQAAAARRLGLTRQALSYLVRQLEIG